MVGDPGAAGAAEVAGAAVPAGAGSDFVHAQKRIAAASAEQAIMAIMAGCSLLIIAFVNDELL